MADQQMRDPLLGGTHPRNKYCGPWGCVPVQDNDFKLIFSHGLSDRFFILRQGTRFWLKIGRRTWRFDAMERPRLREVVSGG